MTHKHFAIYGNRVMRREYCSQCKGMALVVDNLLQCCNSPIKDITPYKKQRVMSEAHIGRKKPSYQQQKKILEVQNNKCLYCDIGFGDLVYRKSTNKIYIAKLVWDHLIPYSYSRENKLNFVASCHICNGIKSNKIFNTVEEVRHYVEYHRKKRGIAPLSEIEVPSVSEGI